MKWLSRVTRSPALAGVAILAGAMLLPVAARATDTATANTLMSRLDWRNVGPYIGGRAVAVDGVADQPNLFYMGAVDGGVWRSTDYGISWSQRQAAPALAALNQAIAVAVQLNIHSSEGDSMQEPRLHSPGVPASRYRPGLRGADGSAVSSLSAA